MIKDIKQPTEKEYNQDAFRLAKDFCPTIYPCQKCGWPVVTGYCCTTCGDTSPSEKEKEIIRR